MHDHHGHHGHGHFGPHFMREPEGHGGGFGHRGHGRPGGLGRFFAHGDLRLVILNLIAEKPSHGYEIIKAIEEAVAGAYSPSPGTIYPTLTLLEELGYVTVAASGDGARKLHEITEQGRAFLVANQPALDHLLSRMAEASRTRGGGHAPQIVRAMENLKLALRLRTSRGPLSEAETDAIAATLDAAAASLEKV